MSEEVKLFPETLLPFPVWDDRVWVGKLDLDLFCTRAGESFVDKSEPGNGPVWVPSPITGGRLASRGIEWSKEDFHELYPLVDLRP